MSGGYNTVWPPYRGSMNGRWPAGPVFISVFVAMMDKDGCVNYSVKALSTESGWPIELLEQGIHDLMQPDPLSRSKLEGGRRLVLIDPSVAWGWRVVNAAYYREKARLMAKAAREKESGQNARRMQDRRGPPETAVDRPSYTNTNTGTESEPSVGLNQDLPLEAAQKHGRGVSNSSERERPASRPNAETAKTTKDSRGTRLGDFPLTPERRKVAAQQGVPDHEIDNEHLLFCNHWRAKSGRDACKIAWDGTWQNWCVKSGREFRDRAKRGQKFSARRPDQQRQTPEDFPS